MVFGEKTNLDYLLSELVERGVGVKKEENRRMNFSGRRSRERENLSFEWADPEYIKRSCRIKSCMGPGGWCFSLPTTKME